MEILSNERKKDLLKRWIKRAYKEEMEAITRGDKQLEEYYQGKKDAYKRALSLFEGWC